MSYNKFAWYAGKLVPCRNFLSGRSRTRTWDLFLIREGQWPRRVAEDRQTACILIVQPGCESALAHSEPQPDAPYMHPLSAGASPHHAPRDAFVVRWSSASLLRASLIAVSASMRGWSSSSSMTWP